MSFKRKKGIKADVSTYKTKPEQNITGKQIVSFILCVCRFVKKYVGCVFQLFSEHFFVQ